MQMRRHELRSRVHIRCESAVLTFDDAHCRGLTSKWYGHQFKERHAGLRFSSPDLSLPLESWQPPWLSIPPSESHRTSYRIAASNCIGGHSISAKRPCS